METTRRQFLARTGSGALAAAFLSDRNPIAASIQQGRVRANGVEFAYLTTGQGPLALCLHGFPDSAWTWREFLLALAGAGYRAVAPWMRGYAPTEIPRDGYYQGGALVADALALHDALGGDEKAVLIGHDWGAYASYGAAAFAPEKWRRVVTMALPPLAAAAGAFRDYDQSRRSWYIFYFQSPIALAAVEEDNLRFLDRLCNDWSPSFDPSEMLRHAKDALRGEDRVSAALGYYRALLDTRLHVPELAAMQEAISRSTPQPTLYLHGARDGAFAADFAHGVESHLGAGSRHVIVPNAGHFLHLERPELVIPEVLRFLRAESQ